MMTSSQYSHLLPEPFGIVLTVATDQTADPHFTRQNHSHGGGMGYITKHYLAFLPVKFHSQSVRENQAMRLAGLLVDKVL